MVARIGEAAHPGPNPCFAIANPTGAIHKGHLFHAASELSKPITWALSETHLTQEGVQRFRNELKYLSGQWRYIPGAYAQPLTQAPTCVGGKATGVGFLTNSAARALPNDWDQETWESARLQACTVRVQQQWVKIGVAYGYAKQPHTRNTREATDQILEKLTQRIVYQSKGYRILCGDFNQEDHDALEQFSIWKNHGFMEVQDVAALRWGHRIQPTCHGKTRKDHMWISPELIPKLLSVTVDPTYFADHAILIAEFEELGNTPAVPIWRKPGQIQWDEIDVEHFHQEYKDPPCLGGGMTEIFTCLETTVDSHLKGKGLNGLIAQQRGRCQTTAASICKHAITPNRPSRKGDVQITYMGEHFIHTKWCRQLRRLQSLHGLMKSTKPAQQLQSDKEDLWQAIKSAAGFGGGFAEAWKQRSSASQHAPHVLPKKLPTPEVVEAIYMDFKAEFETLEKLLIRERCQRARDLRLSDSKAIFRDVAKPRSLPVSTVVVNTNANITDVSVDGLTIKYEPCNLNTEKPVMTQQGPLETQDHQPGVLTLTKPQALEPGDHLAQPKLAGDLQDVFKAFEDLWKPMWQKHQDTSVERWIPIMQEIQQQVPQPPEAMPMPPLTPEQWIKSVRSKKATSAVGPDGVSKLDLLNMPPALVTKLVDHINDIEHGRKEWPQAVMVGLISAIEKHSAAATPAEYRPITVLSMIYRTYSSIRTKQILKWLHRQAPPGLMGNMPNQSTVQVWRALAEQIEHAQYFQSEWTGTVTDVCKCFNTLPRNVVYFLGRHLGLPMFFMKSWMHTLSSIQRRFVVQGSCFPAIMSHTGFAEGDPLSVVSMVLVNCAMHTLVTHKVSPVSVISYVDNWEAQSTQPEATSQALAAMIDFAEAIDIKLDTAKTFSWGTSASSRKALKNQGHVVMLHSKALGGHLNYSKRGTNYSVRARITQSRPLWGWLSRSQAISQRKLRVLYTVAWPRCLHGIGAVDIGIDHFTTLRASAMSALRWEKHGSSSVIQFGLITEPRNDPHFYAIQVTVLQFRQYGQFHLAYEVLDMLANQPPARILPGPCGVLISRLHKILWQWDGNGFVIDHQGFRLHLIDTPIQLLRRRLEHAWAAMVGHNMSSRAEFAGLADVDTACSNHTCHKFSPVEQGLLRVAMNGSFYTRDKQFSSGKFSSKQCPWCTSEDSVFHRTWQCPRFHAEREKLDPGIRKFLMQQPDCTKLHGWFTEGAEDRDFRRALLEAPDTTQTFEHFPCMPETLHLFTDGSASDPNDPQCRIATWAVCLATFPSIEFPTAAAGGVPGLLQTVLRAEITAVVAACRFGIQHRRPFYIWTDCQTVFDRLQVILKGEAFPTTPKQKDHDLWETLCVVATASKNLGLFQKALKVTSHQGEAAYSHTVDKWAAQGNEAADTAAIWARHLLPPAVTQAHARLKAACLMRYQACRAMHRLLVDIGLQVVAEKTALRAQEEAAWDTLAQQSQTVNEVVSFAQLPTEIVPPDEHTLGEGFFVIHRWLLMLTKEHDAEPLWLSSYQLYAHFQMSMNHLGFCYNRKEKQYQSLASSAHRKEYNFVRSAAWFCAMIKCFAKTIGMECTIQPRLPHGTLFRSWQRCILLPASPNTLQRVHQLFARRGTTAVKSVHAALGRYSDFCDGAS